MQHRSAMLPSTDTNPDIHPKNRPYPVKLIRQLLAPSPLERKQPVRRTILLPCATMLQGNHLRHMTAWRLQYLVQLLP